MPAMLRPRNSEGVISATRKRKVADRSDCHSADKLDLNSSKKKKVKAGVVKKGKEKDSLELVQEKLSRLQSRVKLLEKERDGLSKTVRLYEDAEKARAWKIRRDPEDSPTRPFSPAEIPNIRCAICIESMTEWTGLRAFVPCGHILCTDCAQNMELERHGESCPICRAAITSLMPIFLS